MQAIGRQRQRAPNGASVHDERHRPEQTTLYGQVQQHAAMLKRVLDLDLEHCPNCGGELKIIAATLEQPVIGLPAARRSSM